jgi:hypothetical protein
MKLQKMKIDMAKIKINLELHVEADWRQQIRLEQENITSFGIIPPVIIDQDNTIIAGFPQFIAVTRKGVKKIETIKKEGLTILEKLKIEARRDITMRTLSRFELIVIIGRRKQFYKEKFYPIKNPENTNPVANVATKIFSEFYEEILNLKSRTIRRKARLGIAIINREIPKSIIKKFKEEKISERTIYRKLKDLVNGKPDEKDANGLACQECTKARASQCPWCKKKVIICDKGYLILKKPISPACEEFKR